MGMHLLHIQCRLAAFFMWYWWVKLEKRSLISNSQWDQPNVLFIVLRCFPEYI